MDNEGLILVLLMGLCVLGAWSRKHEVDRLGRPCMVFFGLRALLPVVALILLFLLADWWSDAPEFRQLPVFWALLAALQLTIVGAMLVWPYQIVLTDDAIERRLWPRPARRFPLAQLKLIGEARPRWFSRRDGPQPHVLTFSDGRQFQIPDLLSGQEGFVQHLRTLIIARVSDNKGKAHRRERKGKRKS
jgi:hypothetical protein